MGTVTGTSSDDTLAGTPGDDSIQGLGGNDSLVGNGGSDTLDGGAGNDTLNASGDSPPPGGTTFIGGAGNDSFIGGPGADTVTYASSPSGVVVTKPTGTSGGFASDGFGGTDTFGDGVADILIGSGFNDTLLGSPVHTATWGEVFGNDEIYGGAGDDLIRGLDGDDVLHGETGNDTLDGGDGNDELHGGAGNDSIVGGNGFDVATYGNATGGIVANLQTGIVTGGDGNDTLSGIEALAGGAFGDSITGSSGNDSIAGQGGNDTLDGGAGFDGVYYGDASGGVSVNLAAHAASGADGNDIVTNFEAVIGSDFDDTLTGDANANLLEGGDGSDVLRGGAGNDTLIGNGRENHDGNSSNGGNGGNGMEIDTAVFSGNRSDYTLAYDSSTGFLTVKDNVAGRDGTDTLFSIERLQFADQLVAEHGSAGSPDVDNAYSPGLAPGDTPRGTDSVLLSDLGLAPGDLITLTRIGEYQPGANATDTATGFLAVFTDGTNFIAPAVYARITSPSPTDIAQDFFVRGDGTTVVQIPAGATTLEFQVFDGFFSDNSDPDGNFAVAVRKVDAATTFNGDDLMFGSNGDDMLSGGAGRDTLMGGGGNDFLDGGAITDRINYSDANFLTYATSTAGVNINLSGVTGNGTYGIAVDGMGGIDKVANVNFIVGSNFNDTITGSGAKIFEDFTGGAGNDTIDGGFIDPVRALGYGNRANYSGATGGVSVDLGAGTASGGGQGTDTLVNINQVRGSNFADSIAGSDSTTVAEQFEGQAGNDTIDGKGGHDVARYSTASTGVNVNLATGVAQDGQGGTDTLLNIEGIRGSSFNDTLTGGNPANNAIESFMGDGGNDLIDGGAGYDRVEYSSSTSGVNVTLGGFGTGSAQDGLGGTDTLTSIEGVRGSTFDDTLTGGDAAQFESFDGREGNDLIDGRGGADDQVDYQDDEGGVVVDLAAHVGHDGSGGTDTLLNIERVRGSQFDDFIAGDAGNNILEGNAGNDTFVGAAGNDTFIGGAGFDIVTYEGAVSGVVVTQAQDASSTGSASDGSGGTDTIDRSVEVIAGSAFNDTLTGAPVYTLAGVTYGDDELHGGIGNDSLDGESGNDALFGGQGNDTLRGGDGDDFLAAGDGNNLVDGGAGNDWALYESATSAANVNLKTASASGSWGNDTLVGIENAGGSDFNDTLTGDDGNNSMSGRGGNDVIDGGLGFDTARYGSAAAAVSVNLQAGLAFGEGNDTLTGIEAAAGGNFNDTLVGDANGNVLTGGSGDDSLSGAGGNDTLDGGPGNDTLDGGTGSDTAVFHGNFNLYTIRSGSAQGEFTVEGPDGRDTVRNVETFQFDDRPLTVSFGTQAADTVAIAAAAGPVIFDAGGGNDIVTANDSGNALLGGSGNDQLTGGLGSDNLDGGTGNDAMAGGVGDDVYLVDSAGDVVVEVANATQLGQSGADGEPHDINLGGGIDKVVASVNYTLGNFVENLALVQGAGDLSGTGNSLDNVLTGNDGNNTLTGGAGNDTIDGGAGRDTALFHGNIAAYKITTTDAGLVISGADGTDVLTHVERVRFDDFSIAYDIDGDAGLAYRLYQAAFNRTPDIGGLGYQMHDLDIGVTLEQVAANFIASPEFQRTYGNVDDTQFLTLLYNNVLHRAPDAGGLQFHLDEFAHGQSRAVMLIHFSESPENQANVIGAIEDGMVYTY